jgi:hypothetical protein
MKKKEKRAAELCYILAFQNEEKKNQNELVVANTKLVLQDIEKKNGSRISLIPNLLFKIKKRKRAAELAVASSVK